MSKREHLAKVMQHSGFTRLMELQPSQPGLLIISHHRVGDRNATRFDREVFSATTEQLEAQVRYLKARFPVVGGEELTEIVCKRKPLRRLHIAITFDDGYLDNYTHAFPVLRHHGCPGVFFLVPAYVGTDTIPWWDAIAYLVRNSSARHLTFSIPQPLAVSLDGDREKAIHRVLQHYKRADNTHPEAFMAELEAQAGCALPRVGRRFLSWEEAREMQAGGMSIGSHTQTHRILSQLTLEEQIREMTASRAVLDREMGHPVKTLAYPVGIRTAFDSTTEQAARAAGYECCFSFYGGMNKPEAMHPMNVLRTSVEADPMMFRNQVTLMSRFGRLPY